MKKELLFGVVGAGLILSCAAMAQTRNKKVAMPNECAYSPLQQVSRDVRDVAEIKMLIEKGVQFDEDARCGGSLLQLAVRRGNLPVMQAILEQDKARANQMVSLESFPIKDAPEKISILQFASYYAPDPDLVRLLANAGADLTFTDDFGRTLMWYLDKNPTLRKTELEDELNEAILMALANKDVAEAEARAIAEAEALAAKLQEEQAALDAAAAEAEAEAKMAPTVVEEDEE